jgi:ABC-type lipoprotein release transport system permease subunit
VPLAVVLCMVLALVVAIPPARVAMRADPAEALRDE